MTWDAGPCLPAPGLVQPATDDELRAFLTRVTGQQHHAHGGVAMNAAEHDSVEGATGIPEPPDRTHAQDELATRRRHRADPADGHA